MTKFKNVKTIIFDYDGTLHDSSRIYIPAFKRAYAYLVENEQAPEKVFQDQEITRWLGYSKKEMWELFMPHLVDAHKNEASRLIGETMVDKISRKEAHLYPDALETLAYLKEKYTLIFLSNCSIDYMESHADMFNLRDYFTDMYCTEMYDFKKSKKEIVADFKHKYPSEYAIVGDRHQDLEVGELDQTYAIGCSYGFGQKEELAQADNVISDIAELKNMF
ncbi:phosphoglycolate phosphatase [Alkalibacterium subtropicum]|uniref:Phosphoglycolate phosphatase n=1 Tax=Alkalibacterium subtropicum TaxID=753702 RepID=A0A1I1GXK9_9LACT|nr:HAD family hydrolase [Alkalibacterium subtropicum]SFC16216.1 phosphoglycolate phosphatase [Alkalibacterium subtropicum]